MLPGRPGQNADNLLNIKLDELFAAQAVEVTVRDLRDAIVAGDAVPDIDLFGQSHLTDQFQVAPDCAVTDRAILLSHLFVQFIDRNVLTQLEKGAEDQLPLGSHLKPFCS